MAKVKYTDVENDLLVQLVQPHSEIIYSKENSTAMNVKKDKVWLEIANAFNLTRRAKEDREKPRKAD